MISDTFNKYEFSYYVEADVPNFRTVNWNNCNRCESSYYVGYDCFCKKYYFQFKLNPCNYVCDGWEHEKEGEK